MKNTILKNCCRFGSQLRISPLGLLIALMGFLAFGPQASAVPIIFSATESAQAGDLVGIQGTNFGTGSQVQIAPVYSSGSLGSVTTLAAHNSSNAFLSAQLPANLAFGLYALWVQDSSGGQSASVYVNRSRITSFEYPEVEPGRQFRLFGRNLVLAGGTPSVRFQDTSGGASTAGTIVSGGDSYVVSVVTPSTLVVGHTYQVFYKNGFGTSAGETVAPVALTIRAGGTDSFSLGLPWGSDFSAFAANVYNVKTDSRLTLKALGNGSNDDTTAIQNAITAANADGGGVVYLPAGTYKITAGLSLKSKVVLQGAGQSATFITSGVVSGVGISVALASTTVGVMDLTFQNTATITTSTFVFFLTAASDTSKMFALRVTLDGGNWATGGIWMASTTGNRFLISNCTIKNLRRDGRALQLKPAGGMDVTTQYVYIHDNTIPNFNIGLQLGSKNLIYEHNLLNYDGDYYNNLINTLGQTYANISGLQSDSGNQNRINLSGPNLVILNNTFTHSGAPFVSQNDGENMLMEDLTGDFLHSTVSSATSNTLSDTAQNWSGNYAGYNVVIIAGTGLGEMGTVISNTATTLTLGGNWPVTPASDSKYVLCRLNVPHLLIEGNTIQNKNYVLSLFDGGYDVAIVKNTATNSQDLCLRALIQPGGISSLMYGVLLADNTVTATSASRPSCVDTTVDEYYNPRFGSAAFLVEVRRNNVTACGGEAFRQVNIYQSAAGQMFHSQGDGSSYGFEGLLYDRNTASNAITAYGWTPGVDGWEIANYSNIGVLRDSYDISHRDGIAVGTPVWVGGALSLDGSSYLNLSYYFAGVLANWGTLNLPGTMTIEGSFKTTALSGSIISNRPLGDAAVFLDGSGKLAIYGGPVFTGGSIKSPLPVNDGNWHRFAWVSSGPNQLLYLDGTMVSSKSTYTRTGSVGQGWIGSDVNHLTNFVGQLSGLRVWNVARTAAQIASYQGLNLAGDEAGLTQLWRFNETSGTVAHNGVLSDALADGLVASWNYDENTGNTITDSIGGNLGTINGTAGWVTGFFGRALSFNGSTNYVTVPANSSWQGTSGLTVHARVNIASIAPTWAANARHLVSTVDPANPNLGWGLYTYANSSAPTQVGFAFARGTVGSTPVVVSQPITASSKLVTGQYYDVTATYNAGSHLLSLYVNGVLQATQTNARDLSPSTAPLIMGMAPATPTNTAHYLNGILDDVKVYNRALSDSEVRQLDAQ